MMQRRVRSLCWHLGVPPACAVASRRALLVCVCVFLVWNQGAGHEWEHPRPRPGLAAYGPLRAARLRQYARGAAHIRV